MTLPRTAIKPLVFVAALAPGLWVLARAAMGTLGADPIAVSLNALGFWALTLLIATLACTPARIVLHWSWPATCRRMLGLFAFAYALAHFAVYVLVDQGLDLHEIVKDVLERKFMAVGFAAFLLLVPLAATSTNGMIKRFGSRRWNKLHRLAYVSAVLGVVHFAWRVKADLRQPALYAMALGILFAVRISDRLGGRARVTSPSTPSA